MWLPSCMSTLTRIKSNCLFPTGEISKFILTGWNKRGERESREDKGKLARRDLSSLPGAFHRLCSSRRARARNIMHRPVYRRVHLQMHLPNRCFTRFSIRTSIWRGAGKSKTSDRLSEFLHPDDCVSTNCSLIRCTQSRFLNELFNQYSMIVRTDSSNQTRIN